MFAAQPDGLAAPRAFGLPQPNVPDLEMLDETALADADIGAPLPPVELVAVDDPAAMVRAASRVVVLAGSGDGIVDASAAGCCTATRRCCTRPTSAATITSTSPRQCRSRDHHRLESRSRPPVARHAGCRRLHRDWRTCGRRVATRYGGSTSPRIRRPGGRARDNRGGRGTGWCGPRAMASHSPIGRRIVRRWRSTAIRRPRGSSETGSIRSDRASN